MRNPNDSYRKPVSSSGPIGKEDKHSRRQPETLRQKNVESCIFAVKPRWRMSRLPVG